MIITLNNYVIGSYKYYFSLMEDKNIDKTSNLLYLWRGCLYINFNTVLVFFFHALTLLELCC